MRHGARLMAASLLRSGLRTVAARDATFFAKEKPISRVYGTAVAISAWISDAISARL